jgi:hypothetical protein
LPVIDVTNVQRLLLRLLLRKSKLGRGLVAASGTFVDGMTTYLLKLGPGNLGTRVDLIDRRIAASSPALSASSSTDRTSKSAQIWKRCVPRRRPTRLALASAGAAVQPRALEAFDDPARRSGWRIDASIHRPFSYNLRLTKR